MLCLGPFGWDEICACRVIWYSGICRRVKIGGAAFVFTTLVFCSITYLAMYYFVCNPISGRDTHLRIHGMSLVPPCRVQVSDCLVRRRFWAEIETSYVPRLIWEVVSMFCCVRNYWLYTLDSLLDGFHLANNKLLVQCRPPKSTLTA